MPSQALRRWNYERVPSLDEIENAHRSVGGSARGRRYATEQINHAYSMLVSSQFQGYCRDLHTDCAEVIAKNSQHAVLSQILVRSLTRDRKLDRGNPNSGVIGSDFGRFHIDFWTAVKKIRRFNERRLVYIDELNDWRNAIAHQDFNPAKLGGRTTINLRDVRAWRSAAEILAIDFDRVMYNYLTALFGGAPW